MLKYYLIKKQEKELKMEICKNCNHKSAYFSETYGIWRCQHCKKEWQNEREKQYYDFINAKQWWDNLTPERKIEIWQKENQK